MKNLLLSFAALSLFVISCKSKDADINPVTNSIAGEYKITGVTSYTVEGVATSSPMSGTLSVYASSTPNSYYFVERYATTELGYLTTHTDSKFTVQEVPDFTALNNVKYYGFQKGGGTVAANTIKYDRYASTANATYIAPTGSVSYSEKKISKHVSVTATK